MSARFYHDAVIYGRVNSNRKMKNMFSVCVISQSFVPMKGSNVVENC